MEDNQELQDSGDSPAGLDTSADSTSLIQPFLSSDEDLLLSTINQRLHADSIKEAAEFVELYEKVYRIIESKKEAEFKRQFELRKQEASERETQRNLELEVQRQMEVEKQNQLKYELQNKRQQEIEKEHEHRQALELKEFEYKWSFTFLSFMLGVLLILIGFGTSGGIIVGGSLSIPAAGFIKKQLRGVKEGKEGNE
jgi:hypothetical protein